MPSPYDGVTPDRWLQVTEALVREHPISLDQIREASLEAWALVWKTTVGESQQSFPLVDADPPAQIIGYFFEKLLALVLAKRFPGQWRGQREKDEKDLVYEPDPTKSVEVKCSGQLGLRIFGNRSAGQRGPRSRGADKPEKSGYFITVNFSASELMLLRFGWIDQDDWDAQEAATGQAAGLSNQVYAGKLLAIAGDYRLRSPVGILPRVGPSKVEQLRRYGIATVGDLLVYEGSEQWVRQLKESAAQSYSLPRASSEGPAGDSLPRLP